MTRGETPASGRPAEARRGLIEYLLLFALLLVVIVTAWTLWDNGIVDTVARLIEGSPR
ncbi:MAG: hypothetical protein AABZ64_06165 [Nitrospinota bacterium]